MSNEQTDYDTRTSETFEVTINFLSTLPKILGVKERINIKLKNGSNIIDLFDKLIEEVSVSFKKIKDALITDNYKEFGDNIVILLNGKNISAYEGLETIINENDEITMFIPLGGG